MLVKPRNVQKPKENTEYGSAKGMQGKLFAAQQGNHNKAWRAWIRCAVPVAALGVQPTICRLSILASWGPHVLLWRWFREQGQGRIASFTPGASPAGQPVQPRGTSAFSAYFPSWKLLNIHMFSSWGARSNGTSFPYLFRCCLTVFHGLHQGSWKHVMSNISIFYCYATFQCFGLEMATWILLCRHTYMHLHDFSTQIFLTEISIIQMVAFLLIPCKGSYMSSKRGFKVQL